MATGFFKRPVSEPVAVTAAGPAGDVVADQARHGGPDQVVYLYSAEDYRWWSAQLGRELAPGSVRAGDALERLGGGEAFPTADELFALWFNAPRNPARLRRARAILQHWLAESEDSA